MNEYCNPLDLPYRFQHYGKTAHREAADPTLIYFKEMYYLFPSMTAGFFYGKDLFHWQYHENRNLEIYHYAPDVRQIGDYMYFCASDRNTPCRILRSRNPLDDDFEEVSAPFDFWDPDMFCDDDGRVYLYWGCGNREPIWGIEMDPKTMLPIGTKKAMLDQDKEKHGWERFNFPGKEEVRRQSRGLFIRLIMKLFNKAGRPYMEGAFMTKINGRYYLQYAAPGTEYPVYGDGYYVGDSPLGPFSFAPNTPFSLKPGGFITGAGHGSTIYDTFGNLWHIATMRISVNQDMERRVGLFPAGVDEDGLLFCNQNFADYPIVIPDGKFDPKGILPHYMLLSYRKKVTASSSIEGHPAELAVDENIRDWWCADGGAGESFTLDLGKIYTPHSLQINFAEEGIPVKHMPKDQCSQSIATGKRYIDTDPSLHTRYTVEGSTDGQTYQMLFDCSSIDSDQSHPYLLFEENTNVRYLKITAIELPYHSNFALSGVRVFGLDDGEKPAKISEAAAELTEDRLSARLTWNPVKDAVGYNIRFGIAPDKLYHSWMVYDAKELLITTLNADQKYWFCIDSFNESGVTEGAVFSAE